MDILVKSGATPAQIQAAGNRSSIHIPMDLYRDGVTDQDRGEAAAMLGKAMPGRKPSTPTPTCDTPCIEVSIPETDPDLAQLLKAKDLTDAEVDEVLELTKWAWVELNYRPHAYRPPEPGGGQRPPA